MSPSLGPLSGRGGTLWRRGERTKLCGTVALVLLVVAGSAGLFALAAPTALAPRGASASLVPSVTTHGDLVVPAGATVTIGPSLGTATYYQGGNITVQSGGTLVVQNTVLSFVQFVAAGSLGGNAFSHIYRFVDQGTVLFTHSTLTTSVALPNASAKLFVSVSGSLNAVDSTFAFPGWLNVVGSGAVATFNGSTVEGNPAVASVVEPTTIQADTLASPVLNVSGGAELNLFGSAYFGLNQDNLSAYGVPAPQNLTMVGSAPIGAGGSNLTTSNFTLLGTTSAQLVQDMLYPSEASAVTISLAYSNGAASTVTSAVNVYYDGNSYAVGTASFASGGGTMTLVAPSTSLLVQSMYQDGTPFFASAGINFAAPSATGVTVTGMTVNLTPAVNYNLTASGAGTRLNAVDSLIGLNFNPTLSNNSSAVAWASNKLVVDAGATAFLANLTVTSSIPELFASSAVQVASGGVAYVYRWAQANLTGGPNSTIGMYGATMSAFYAFDSNQLNNATANALNDLATASPAIWGYVQYVDGSLGRPGYGMSGPNGAASLLLASTEITSTSLPDGTFLGDYHLGVTAPLTPPVTSWVTGAVSPYPQGTAAGTPGYGSADYVSQLTFPQYSVNASVGNVTVSANAVVSSTVRVGEVLGVNVTFTNVGLAPVYALTGALYWNSTHTVAPLDQVSLGGLALANNQSVSLYFTWVVNDTITGLHGTFSHSFSGTITWFGNPNGSYQGSLGFAAPVTISPSTIVITSASAPPSSVSLTQFYYTTGTVVYNGSYPATIDVLATPSGGGSAQLVGSTSTMSGSFTVNWAGLSSLLSAGTTYTVTVVAKYDGATSVAFTAGQFSTPATTTTSKNFLEQTYFGLPLWLYLAIAAAIVVGVVAFLLFARRTAAGKLVECGECGNLIPEEATICPKCGAEFEADLIRCSRCASTIPANSKVCPECAAQLLGKPGEADDDPERQGYADFTERFRAEAKKELGDNYTEGAFWDWWKRQPTYTPFGQWKLQQGQGTSRSGMAAPPTSAESAPKSGAPRTPSGSAAAAPPAPLASPARTAATAAPPPAAAPSVPSTGVHACPNCGKEIPTEYLVCPFCGAVTQ